MKLLFSIKLFLNIKTYMTKVIQIQFRFLLNSQIFLFDSMVPYLALREIVSLWCF